MADIEFKQGTNTDSAYVDGHKVRLIAIPSGTLELPISATRDSGYVVDGDGKKHKVILATFLTETPEYKDSPTADTAYVTVDGQKVKVTLTAELSSNLQLPESATADQGYAEDTDGNKHRVTLVATPTGTLQLPNSETDDTAYVIDSDGKKHKVRLFVSTTGPGYIEVVVRGTSPLSLPDAVADSLQYLKAYGDCENRNLPEGYQELEYIEGNNNEQYINTGIVPTSSMSMYFKGQFVSVDESTPTQVSFLAGARDVGGQYGFFLQLASTNVGLDWFVVNGRWTENHTRANGDVVEMKVNNSLAEIWINGTSVGTHQYTPDDTTQYPLFLNGLNSVGQPFSNVNSINRVYRFTIDGIADMRPARRLSDGVLGMYDTIRKRFFTNAGTGDFTAGSVVSDPTPTAPQDIWCNNGAIKAIRPIKYLESTGTQYIDTGFKPSNNTRIVLDIEMGDLQGFIYGARKASTSSDMFFLYAYTSGNKKNVRRGYASNNPILSADDTLPYRRLFIDNNKRVLNIYEDDTAIITNTLTAATFDTSVSLYLFSCNTNGSEGNFSAGKIYSCKIYEDGVLVRDFIPALDANNVPCLFDKVEGKCYYNAGTGQFIAGYLPAEYEELEYIQGYCSDSSDSTIKASYIDTDIILPADANFYLKSQLASSPTTNSYLMCGTRTTTYAGSEIYVGSSNTVIDWYGSAESDRLTINDGGLAGDIYEIIGNNKTLTVFKNGSNIGYKTFNSPTTPTLTFWLNSRNTNNQVTSQTAPTLGRIYRFTVAGVCDMIPARKRSNGHIGMYDLVRRQFFDNAGEGQFTFGKLPILPETYTQLEYIESTGTQWLETGVSIAGGCVIEAKAKVIENQFLIGSQVSGQPDTTRCRVYFDGVNQGLLAQKLNVTATLAPIADTSQPFEFKMDTIGTGFYFYVNGSLIYSNASSGTIGSQTNNGIKIAYNNATGTAYKQTVYWVKIYDSSNVLVRYLIPAKRNSDSVVGMYDIMNDVFLTNQGTGDFEYGSEIPDSRESYYCVDGVVETITTNAGGSVLSTATCENLLGIGSTQDVQEILTGEITRNVGVYVLTGNEVWEKLNFAGKSVFRAKDVIPADRYSNPENNIGLCSHFTVIPTSAGVTSAMNNLELAWNTNSLMCIRYDSMANLTDFLAFLRSQYDAGTPVTIVYPLATAQTESVAGQTLTVSAGNNTAEITQASIDDLELEVKYEKNV